MAMFDLEDSEDIKLTNNKSGNDFFLKGKGLKRVSSDGNEAGVGEIKRGRPDSIMGWIKANVTILVVSSISTILGGLALIYIQKIM